MSHGTGRNRITRLLVAAFLLLAANGFHAVAHAQSVVEAKFVLHDITRWFGGTFDNEPQIYLDAAFGENDEGPQRWEHMEFSRVEGTGMGDVVFYGSIRRRDLPDHHAGHRLFTFEVDEAARAVRMRYYVVEPDKVGADFTDPTALAAAATVRYPECPIWWRQGPEDSIYGSMKDVWCQVTLDDGAKLLKRSDWVLTEGELSVFMGSRDPVTLERSSGRHDEIPLRFTRARDYECFVNIRHTNGSGATVINPFTMHDAGDRYVFQTEEPEPRKFEIVLRRSMWPSRSGRNFVPLLGMWVYANGNTKEPYAGVWSSADSGRVGWDFHPFGGGRCKIPQEMPL